MAALFVLAALSTASTVLGTELVPERYLRPRDFNHHPFTDVGNGGPLKQQLTIPDDHPYALLASKRPREGRQFPDQNVILYPNPPSEILPKKPHAVHLQYSPEIHQIQPQLHVQPQVQAKLPVSGYEADPYNGIPKNYAFSYSVRDQHSGDDFSHSQAHNGKATRGQYRVKLPDGRVQVVSYTADHKGYRADVQYEGEALKHSPQPTPIYEHPTESPNVYHTATPASYIQEKPHYRPTPTPYVLSSPTPAPYREYSPSPSPHYIQTYIRPTADYSYGNQQHNYASPTPATYDQSYASPSPTAYEAYPSPSPDSYRQDYPPQSYEGLSQYASPTGKPYQGLSAYASPSPTPYDQQYASPSPTPYSQPEYDYGSSAQFSVQPYLRSTPAPFTHPTQAPYAQEQYVTSTEAPSGGSHVLVTPRTLFNAELARRGFTDDKGNRQHILYRFNSPSS